MADLVWLIPAFPLFGFLTLLLLGRRFSEPLAGYFATAMVFVSWIVAVAVYFDLVAKPEEERSVTVTLFSWLPVGDLQIDMAFLADPLSITMCLFVLGIGGLIHLFAVGYMHGDPKFSKFFLYLSLFIFSMTLLVLGENLLVTFLGWEGVGTCSYLLISFWHTRESAATAGKKAFITNRVGDFGVMLAMFLAFESVGSVSYSALNGSAVAGTLSAATASAIAMLLLLGATGKSAQLPLYVWLPDAMEGPTPVSALIHAATMVTGGVFLLVRINPVITVAADWVPMSIAWVGGITALFAATIAVAQNDIKKVLAYSTVSQIGFMMLAVGTGAYVAAIFHMITHAMFKALLFLGSGSVIHGMHDEQDMRKMGALRKFMPITAATFIVGWLAIAGVPPFSGFFSKDEILLFTLAESVPLYVIGITTALLTAFYMTRQVMMVFFGEARWKDPAEGQEAHGDFKPHESPAIMWFPLVVLAGLAAIGGIINLPGLFGIPSGGTHRLEEWLHPVIAFGEADIKGTFAYDNKYVLVAIAVACAVGGIALGWLVYLKNRLKPIEPVVFARGWYYDTAISWFMGNPGREVAQGVADFDANVVDGAVRGVATAVRATASETRKAQTGYVRQYAAVVGVGVVLLLTWFVVIRGIL
ncbi:MAG: NADH-quinone oxidoreductase subunit L [Ilumatobacter sp.]|nr:NADH-quinone oxidoreductase subunit L [Ilumatobacter sp.]MDG2041060.1 NADH-quinone oxidoreductase subunit L [Ilumatobacter sp.]